jgi:predicted NBD/HSP70 family sugar kinase
MPHEPAGQRSETVRRANLSAIVRELHGRGPLSRSELAIRTGLTRSAIRALIGEFVAAELVSEGRAAPLGTPGRPSPLVRLNPHRAVVLALEIAVDSMAVGIVGVGGEVFELERVDRPRGDIPVDDTIDDLVALARQVQARAPADGSLIGIGVAVHAIVRRNDGLVALAPNLGWGEVPLGDWLGRALQTTIPISVANEADLGALAEYRRGAARGYDNVLFVSSEVGVGGGLIVGGTPLTGVAGYGGEVGHMTVNPDGGPCRCGSFGCWETEVGERALLRRAGHDADGGRDAVDAFLRDAAINAPAALSALEETGRWLGIGLAGLVNIFNPRRIVLGGLFGRIHPFVAATVARELDRRALPESRKLVTVVPGELGVDAPLLGAAELALDPLLAEPALWLRSRAPHPELATA